MFWIMFLQQTIASVTVIFAKNLTKTLQPEVILFFRALIASLAYFCLLILRWKKLKAFKIKDIPMILLLGAFNIPLNQYLFFLAADMTTAPNISLIYAMSPVFVFAIGTLFMGEKATKQRLIGILTAFFGALFILFEHGFDFSSKFFIGNIIVMTACISWALYTLFGKQIVRKYGAIVSNAFSTISGFLLYLPIFLFVVKPFSINEIESFSWFQITFLALITSGLGYVLWYFALKKLDASRVAVYNNLQIVITTVLAMAFLGHKLTLMFIIGSVLVFIGVIITQKE